VFVTGCFYSAAIFKNHECWIGAAATALKDRYGKEMAGEADSVGVDGDGTCGVAGGPEVGVKTGAGIQHDAVVGTREGVAGQIHHRVLGYRNGGWGGIVIIVDIFVDIDPTFNIVIA